MGRRPVGSSHRNAAPTGGRPSTATVVYDPLYLLDESARYLKMHARELRRLVAAGEIAAVRASPQGRIKIRLSVLNSWIEDHSY